MSKKARIFAGAVVLGLSLIATGAAQSHSMAAPANHPGILQASVDGAPATSRAVDLKRVGYVEQEWTLSGSANVYESEGDWQRNGLWQARVQQAGRPYVSRVLVRRPADPTRFNGVVVVEWLNVTFDFDFDAGWILAHEELIREGYAWVGVSAEPQGIHANQKHDPARYRNSHIDSTDFSYDVYSQAGLAVRQQAPALFGRTTAVTLLGMGYSRSAMFMFTYINAFQLRDRAYDGFLLQNSGPVGAPVGPSGWGYFAPSIRPDLNVPVMLLQTEMEVMVSWPLSKAKDTDKVRYWEVVGASHLNRELQEQAATVASASYRNSLTGRCYKPLNTLPLDEVSHAALHALHIWVKDGVPPTKVPRMARHALGFLRYDDDGHAVGGLRLPEVSVPTAQYGMYSNFRPWALDTFAQYNCSAGGSTQPFDPATLHRRYATRADYLQRYQAAADAMLRTGLLRPADHAKSLARAAALPWSP